MNKDTMKALHMLAYILLFIGGLNWGLWGLLGINVVSMLVGAWPTLERVVYVVVGIATVYVILTHRGDCKVCSSK